MKDSSSVFTRSSYSHVVISSSRIGCLAITGESHIVSRPTVGYHGWFGNVIFNLRLLLCFYSFVFFIQESPVLYAFKQSDGCTWF